MAKAESNAARRTILCLRTLIVLMIVFFVLSIVFIVVQTDRLNAQRFQAAIASEINFRAQELADKQGAHLDKVVLSGVSAPDKDFFVRKVYDAYLSKDGHSFCYRYEVVLHQEPCTTVEVSSVSRRNLQSGETRDERTF